MPEDSANAALHRFADVRWYDEVDSTNLTAAEVAGREGAVPVVVVADHQKAGRGRLHRIWEAPPGSSLLLSVVLPPPTRERPAHLATMAMALAAAEACEDVAGVRPSLKWPNDLLVGEAKVGGILGQVSDGALIVGLGLNVNWVGVAPPGGGIALDSITSTSVDRRALAHALLGHLEQHVSAPVDRLLEAYRTRCATLGRQVRVQLGSETVVGEAVAISSHGHLLVDQPGRGRHVIAAADVVHLRRVDG